MNAGDVRQERDELKRKLQQAEHQLAEAERGELADNLVRIVRRFLDEESPRRFADALEIATTHAGNSSSVSLDELVGKLVDIKEGR